MLLQKKNPAVKNEHGHITGEIVVVGLFPLCPVCSIHSSYRNVRSFVSQPDKKLLEITFVIDFQDRVTRIIYQEAIPTDGAHSRLKRLCKLNPSFIPWWHNTCFLKKGIY